MMAPRSTLLLLLLLLLLILPGLATPIQAAPPLQVIHGQPSWKLASDKVELFVTETGAHMAPVMFERAGHPVQPYYISPWQEEGLKLDAAVLVPLRGDFFCMPFGANDEAYKGEQHPPHGEVAGAKWSLVKESSAGGLHQLTLELATNVRKGKVTNEVSLVDGQNVVYTRHRIEGFAGPTSLGHHATLRLPDTPETFKVQSSRFAFGMTNPTLFSNPEKKEYQCFAIASGFDKLDDVRTLYGDHYFPFEVDATLFPARLGFADLLAIYKRPDAGPAWMIAINRQENYLWFSLKDPAMLPATVFWIENHGRHDVPWNGRNRCLGLEDVCAYFAEGLVPSITPNVVTKEGIETSRELSATEPTEVRYIQGAVNVPDGFDEVQSVDLQPGKLIVTPVKGTPVTIPVRHEFLKDGLLR